MLAALYGLIIGLSVSSRSPWQENESMDINELWQPFLHVLIDIDSMGWGCIHVYTLSSKLFFSPPQRTELAPMKSFRSTARWDP